ncbi:DUF4178 domain-containing protein [Catalinimonas niigatensis]|uniref:DUF4178 domain-containing protein n=1 Tax=Catalinimonas niigatensis TaxID=1397264 RepID=UPI002665F89B|nr:DUF4178 domain-containing protein [Catalinimonas niigatensis]WPP48223.1 DUF4178 domain-containing protein [Catalinimonas niigatensis]
MWATIFFIIVIIGIAMFFWQKNKQKKEQEAKLNTPKELTLENVGPGGVIHLMNVGPNMEEYDVTILSKSIYREGESDEWYELEGDNGKQKVWISIEEDDGLDVTLALRTLKLREIPINRSDLDRMDEAAEGEFEFEDQTFYFEYSNEASFFSDGNTSAENESFFYYWEFENEKEDQFITIEEWENGKFEITLSVPLKSSQVKVYSLGGATV